MSADDTSMHHIHALLPAALQDLAHDQHTNGVPSAPSQTTGSPSTPRNESTSLITQRSTCPHCSGSGVYSCQESEARRRIVVDRYYGDKVLVICSCVAGIERARRWIGLPDEARGVTLDQLSAWPPQEEALPKVLAFVARPQRWLTLVGPRGVGKTTLLYAALNHLAAQGVYGVYTTAPDLLAHMRATLEQGTTESDMLRRLAEVPVLAVDELCKYRSTPYAEEAIFRLFDARYRARNAVGTLIAFNKEHLIPDYLLSRISDGRFDYIRLAGKDLRPHVTQELTPPSDPWETAPWTI